MLHLVNSERPPPGAVGMRQFIWPAASAFALVTFIVAMAAMFSSSPHVAHTTARSWHPSALAITSNEYSSNYVRRHIVSDVQEAVIAALQGQQVTQAAILHDCNTTATINLARLEHEGILATCVSTLADAVALSTAPRRKLQKVGMPSSKGSTAVMTVSQDATGAQLATHIMLVNVLHHAPSVSTVVEMRFDSTGQVVRALMLDLNTQVREVFFTSSIQYTEVFNRIYDHRIWGPDGGRSGPGATLASTAVIRAALPSIISNLGISTMLDTSVGSMHWMPLMLEEIESSSPGFRFRGIDVVCSLVDAHTQTYRNKTNWSFGCLDFASQPLPTGYDLVWSRDALQHLPPHAAWQFLNNVRDSGAKYLLVGSYVQSVEENRNIQAGDFYPINLLAPPFNLRPAPLKMLAESPAGPDTKFMLLFDMETLEWDDPLSSL